MSRAADSMPERLKRWKATGVLLSNLCTRLTCARIGDLLHRCLFTTPSHLISSTTAENIGPFCYLSMWMAAIDALQQCVACVCVQMPSTALSRLESAFTTPNSSHSPVTKTTQLQVLYRFESCSCQPFQMALRRRLLRCKEIECWPPSQRQMWATIYCKHSQVRAALGVYTVVTVNTVLYVKTLGCAHGSPCICQNCPLGSLHQSSYSAVAGAMSQLTGLKRLRCSHNRLTSDSVPWNALCNLSQLTLLSLDHNSLQTLEPALFQVLYPRPLKREIAVRCTVSLLFVASSLASLGWRIARWQAGAEHAQNQHQCFRYCTNTKPISALLSLVYSCRWLA